MKLYGNNTDIRAHKKAIVDFVKEMGASHFFGFWKPENEVERKYVSELFISAQNPESWLSPYETGAISAKEMEEWGYDFPNKWKEDKYEFSYTLVGGDGDFRVCVFTDAEGFIQYISYESGGRIVLNQGRDSEEVEYTVERNWR